MQWIPWTDKTNAIPFKSSVDGVGDGEHKVAYELSANGPMGQNSTYDIQLLKDGVIVRYDVKKLDKGTFNTGVGGKNAIRRYNVAHIKLLESFEILSKTETLSEEECNTVRTLSKINPDELSEGSLSKLNNACAMLNKKRNDIIADIPHVKKCFDTPNPISIRMDKYCSMYEQIHDTFPEEYSEYETRIQFIKNTCHPYIVEPRRFMDDLHGLVNMLFDQVKIIIVDAKMGFMIVDDISKIRFLRITRGGHPRFKVII